ARGRRRYRIVGGSAEEYAAPGARPDPDRRDPRPRDDGARDRLCRDRAPGDGHAARQQREPGARPDHQLFSRGPPPAVADGSFAEPEGDRLAEADPARRLEGPRPCGRAAADLTLYRGPDPEGRGARDQGADEEIEGPRHADVRPRARRAIRPV